MWFTVTVPPLRSALLFAALDRRFFFALFGKNEQNSRPLHNSNRKIVNFNSPVFLLPLGLFWFEPTKHKINVAQHPVPDEQTINSIFVFSIAVLQYETLAICLS